MTVAKNGRYGSLSSTDKALLFSSLGSLLWVTTPLLFNTGSTEISFTLLLKNHERGSGQLVGTYRSDYMFKQKHRGGDTKKTLLPKSMTLSMRRYVLCGRKSAKMLRYTMLH